MNTLFNKHRWMQVMWGVLLIAAGGITILFASLNEQDKVSLAFSISIAIVLFAYGLTVLFSSFLEIREQFFKLELIIGTLIIAGGVVFCLNIDLVEDILVSLIASTLLTFGAVFLVRGIIVNATKLKVWWVPICYIFGVLFIAAGVLALIFKDRCVTVCYIALGAILVLLGAVEVYVAIKRSIELTKVGIEEKNIQKEEKRAEKKNDTKAIKEIDVSKEEEEPVVETVEVVEAEPVVEAVVEEPKEATEEENK